MCIWIFVTIFLSLMPTCNVNRKWILNFIHETNNSYNGQEKKMRGHFCVYPNIVSLRSRNICNLIKDFWHYYNALQDLIKRKVSPKERSFEAFTYPTTVVSDTRIKGHDYAKEVINCQENIAFCTHRRARKFMQHRDCIENYVL